MSSEEEEINRLLKRAADKAGKDEFQDAAEEMSRARRIAKRTENERLIKQVEAQAKEIFGKHRHATETQPIRMDPVKAYGFILDIGEEEKESSANSTEDR